MTFASEVECVVNNIRIRDAFPDALRAELGAFDALVAQCIGCLVPDFSHLMS